MFRLPTLTTLAVVALAGCSSAADSGSTPGALGNGVFFFACDDANVCAKYSDNAQMFPKEVSLTSTFSVRFVPNSTGLNVDVDNTPTQGITIEPVADYVTIGPKGLTAVKAGIASLAARDASGQVIDYVVITVVKPDALAVYDADESSDGTTTPTVLSSLVLAPSTTKHVKAFAQAGKQDLAGSLQLQWTSSDTSIVDVQSVANGKATLLAVKAGNATLTAVGGTFTQKVAVEVTP